MDVPDTSISLPLYFFHYYFLEAGAQEIWISQQERNMDGCDISNQLTGVFYRAPPPLWNKARKSRFLRLKLSCISGGVGTIQTFYQQHQNKCKSKSKSYFGQNQSCGDLQIINNLILTDMGNSCISHLRETQYLGLVSIYVISYYIIIF